MFLRAIKIVPLTRSPVAVLQSSAVVGQFRWAPRTATLGDGRVRAGWTILRALMVGQLPRSRSEFRSMYPGRRTWSAFFWRSANWNGSVSRGRSYYSHSACL